MEFLSASAINIGKFTTLEYKRCNFNTYESNSEVSTAALGASYLRYFVIFAQRENFGDKYNRYRNLDNL